MFVQPERTGGRLGEKAAAQLAPNGGVGGGGYEGGAGGQGDEKEVADGEEAAGSGRSGLREGDGEGEAGGPKEDAGGVHEEREIVVHRRGGGFVHAALVAALDEEARQDGGDGRADGDDVRGDEEREAEDVGVGGLHAIAVQASLRSQSAFARVSSRPSLLGFLTLLVS